MLQFYAIFGGAYKKLKFSQTEDMYLFCKGISVWNLFSKIGKRATFDMLFSKIQESTTQYIPLIAQYKTELSKYNESTNLHGLLDSLSSCHVTAMNLEWHHLLSCWCLVLNDPEEPETKLVKPIWCNSAPDLARTTSSDSSYKSP